jgi:hypothetical protein
MSTIKTTTLSTQGGSTVPVDTVVNGTAKAWVNFNGTGTVAIRRAFNVASITDNGTGDYTVNFTTAFPDTSYALCGNSQFAADGGSVGNMDFGYSRAASAITINSVRVMTVGASNQVAADNLVVTAVIFS